MGTDEVAPEVSKQIFSLKNALAVHAADERMRTGFCNKVGCENCLLKTEGAKTYGDCRESVLRKFAPKYAQEGGV